MVGSERGDGKDKEFGGGEEEIAVLGAGRLRVWIAGGCLSFFQFDYFFIDKCSDGPEAGVAGNGGEVLQDNE